MKTAVDDILKRALKREHVAALVITAKDDQVSYDFHYHSNPSELCYLLNLLRRKIDEHLIKLESAPNYKISRHDA